MPFYDHTKRLAFSTQYQHVTSHAMRAMWHCMTICGHAKVQSDWGVCTQSQGYLLHYVLSGKGWATTHGRRFPAKAGDVIFLDTGALYELTVDPDDPWEVFYISFQSATAHHWIEQMQCDQYPVFHPGDARRMRRLFQKAIRLARRQAPGFEAQISTQIHHIVADLFAQQEAERMRGMAPATGATWETAFLTAPSAVKTVMTMIQRHYHLDHLKLPTMLAHTGGSRSVLYALCKRHLKQSPMSALCEFRILKSEELLAYSNLPVKDICARVGIPDANYFSRLFRKKTGVTARQYRARLHRRGYRGARSTNSPIRAPYGSGNGAP